MADTASNLTELTGHTRRLTTEYAVSRLLTGAGAAAATIASALEVVGRDLQCDYCACWRLELTAPQPGLRSETMRMLASWQRHPERCQALEQRRRSVKVAPGVGPVGRAWRLGASEWIEEGATEAGVLDTTEVRIATLGAGVCCPIEVRGSVIGVVEFLAAAGATLDPSLLPMLVALASQMGQFLDREAMEAALRASEARYRSLFDANVAGVHCGTLAGATVAVNPAFVRMFGFNSMAEALTCDARDLYVDPVERLRMMEQLQRTGIDANRQLQLRGASGEAIWVLANTVLVPGADGTPDMCESTVIDITESKDMERRFLQTSKMEGIGRLAGGIAHDFNNLLTVINGYSDVLLAKMAETNPARGELMKIRKAGERAETLTQQLMAFSRQQTAQPVLLELEETVAETVEMLRGLLGGGVRIRCFAEPALGRILADPGQIGQIVMNLAINARDAMPEGGNLLLEMNNFEVDASYARRHIQARPGRFVRLAISDTGCGMDATTRNRAFEPFFTTKPRGKGTGLGLATVYGLVLQNGGWIELYSEAGHGTTFKIYLPRADTAGGPETASAGPARKARGTAGRGKGAVVLIAEDEAEVRVLMKEVLGEAGYRIGGAASDGLHAWALTPATGQALDLLVADVIMPGLTGPELADRLWARHPAAKVLFVSGYTEQAVIHQGLLPTRKAGVGYLQKPFSPEALLAKASALLVRRRDRSATLPR